MKKRISVMFLVLLLSCTTAFTAGKGELKEEAISFMYQGIDIHQAAYKDVAEKFTAETGIEVELRYAPHDVYHEQLAGAIAGNDVADIIQLDGPFLSNLAWSGVIVPLEEYIDPAIIADMTASNKAQCTYPIDGEMYAIGHIDSTVLLYANKSYLKKIGARIPKSVEEAWTIEEFEGYLAKLAELPEVQYPLDIMRAYGVKSEWGTYGFYTAFLSNGGGIIDRKTWRANGMLNSPESVEVAEKFQTWAKNGWIVPASAGANLLFNEDRAAAMAWCGNWFWAQAYPTLGDDLVAVPLPDWGKGVKSPNASWIFAISKDANKELAGKFISFMLTEKAFLDVWKSTGDYPGLKSWVSTDPLYGNPEKMLIAAQQADTAIPRPPHPAYPTITSAFMKAYANILDGADVKATLDAAVEEIDQDIDDHDGYPPFGG